MKRVIAILFAIIIASCAVLPVCAADGRVTYSGNSGEFIFEPGSENSPTDLFSNFKGVMPGDVLTQKITVKNNADDKVKVRIYIRSLGAQEDTDEFLSELGLKVRNSADNEMAYMFDAAANETERLTDWVYLGMLYSGGEVNLDLTLEVPLELDNKFQSSIGYLDWEFKVQEIPAEPDDPQAPSTGDNFQIEICVLLLAISAIVIIFFLFFKKRRVNKEK